MLKKRIIGCLYWYLLRPLFDRCAVWRWRIEKRYLGYCCAGCQNCYKWMCAVRRTGETPYKTFRRKGSADTNELIHRV